MTPPDIKNINRIINEIIIDSFEDDKIDEQLINSYNQLNDKCNQVILKIKNRKEKKRK